MLFAFVFVCTQAYNAVHSDVSLQTYGAQFAFVVGIFVLFDAGYVTIARALPFRREGYDIALFLLMLVGFAFLMIAPYYVMLPSNLYTSARWILLSPLFVLALRLVLGLLYGKSGR